MGHPEETTAGRRRPDVPGIPGLPELTGGHAVIPRQRLAALAAAPEPVDGPAVVVPGSLGERLRAARDRTFVGRALELTVFRAALPAGAVLFVHGPGGIGKSTLLRRYADEARDAGRAVVELDGASPAFQAGAGRAAGAGPSLVLLIDNFGPDPAREAWLRDVFLPGLPGGALVVVAGREPPSPAWTSDLAWADALRVLPLTGLDPADADRLLAVRGMERAARQAVLAFAGGHPLALSLAATLPTAPGQGPWRPAPGVLASLLGTVIGEVPSVTHRLALEVAAHVLTTTEGLLRAVTGAADAGALFTWLRGLPFAQVGPDGLRLTGLVAEAVDADLRWRDPQGYEAMHRLAGAYLIDRVRATGTPEEALTAMRAVHHLQRHGPRPLPLPGPGVEEPLPAAQVEEAFGLLSAADRAAAAFWLRRLPEAFRVCRTAPGAPISGLLVWLRLPVRDPEECANDPVVAAAWAYVEQARPLGAGEHIGVVRVLADPTGAHLPLMRLSIGAQWLRSDRLAWSFLPWDSMRTIPPGHVHAGPDLLACDWRVTPPDVWLSLTAADPTPAAHAPAALSRSGFDTAVREALRDFHRPAALAASPLLRTRMVSGTAGDPVDALRDLLTDAVDGLREDSGDARLHRTVATTFFHRLPTQVAAAERLGLSFSTYRRLLHRGLERVCERLWLRESGAPTGAT